MSQHSSGHGGPPRDGGGGPPRDGGGGPPRDGGKPPASKPLQKRTITITLTIPTCISCLIALILGIIWVFFLGIMLGRGHIPEEAIPNLQKMMPQATQESPAVVVRDGRESSRSGIQGAPAQPESVLQQQELGYYESLKEKPKVVSSGTRSGQSTSRRDQAASKKQEKKTTPKNEPAKRQVRADDSKKNSAPSVRATGKDVFDYQFQVAAFRQKSQAEALTKKLRQSGFTVTTVTSVENGKDWYRNVVHFRGEPDDVDVLRERLRQHNITTLIRKAKTPVSR